MIKNLLLIGLAGLLLAGCNNDDDDAMPTMASLNVPLTAVATSTVQWTGVAVAQDGRVFASFPRMETDTVPYSLAVVNGAAATPFPNADWNT